MGWFYSEANIKPTRYAKYNLENLLLIFLEWGINDI